MSIHSWRASTPDSHRENTPFWPTSHSRLSNMIRAKAPNLSISQLSAVTPDSRLNSRASAKLSSSALVVSSKSQRPSSTLCHPSDVGDPDEVRDFSSVKAVRLSQSRAIVPLSTSKRVKAALEPIHSVFDDTTLRHLSSWPANPRSVLSSSQASERPALPGVAEGAHLPASVTLKGVRDFIDDEMRLVRRGDTVESLCVYREAFVKLAEDFHSFGPLLDEIRQAYEVRLAELEDTCQAFMMGDKSVQEEKEKLLTIQNDTISAFEKEKKFIDGLRVRALESEEAKAAAQAAFEKQLSTVQEEVIELKNQLLMERTVRLEHEDNLNTALRMMKEAQEAAVKATEELQTVEVTLSTENERLAKELAALKREYEVLNFRSDEAALVAERKYRELLARCVDEEKLAAMKLSLEKIGRTNVVLSKRNAWLEHQHEMYIQNKNSQTACESIV